MLVWKIVAVAAIFLFLPVYSGAEIYKYTDEKGTTSFTDNPGNIPKKIRDKHELYEDDNYDMSSTSFRYINNQILVPVTVRYRGVELQATFLMDTGATGCTISPELANRLNIRSSDTSLGFAQGVGGSMHRVGRAVLDTLTVGPHRKYDISISIIPTGGNDGLLGMNFLHGLRYRLNFDTNQIVWNPE